MQTIVGTITPGRCFIMPDDDEEPISTPVMLIVEDEDAAAWREQLDEVMAEDQARGSEWQPRDQRPDLERGRFAARDLAPAYEPRKHSRTVTPFQCWAARKADQLCSIKAVAKIAGVGAGTIRSQLAMYHRNMAIARGEDVEGAAKAFVTGRALVDNRFAQARVGKKA